MPIAIMSLKSFWERHRAHRWAGTAALPNKAATPQPFQPLTHQQSIAILADTVEWLMDETRATLAMPDGPLKDLRKAELRARDQSLFRDFRRLVKNQES